MFDEDATLERIVQPSALLNLESDATVNVIPKKGISFVMFEKLHLILSIVFYVILHFIGQS